MSKRKVVTVDVREDIRNGREPFSKIMQTVVTLPQGADLRLLAPFEPAPLYAVLAQQGFSHNSKSLASGDWEVTFSRSLQNEPLAEAEVSPDSKSCAGAEIVDLDARGLEPPQPLVTILEALTTLPDKARLRAYTDRRPMHLYAQLEARGFTGETLEQPDGSFVTYVSRA